MTLPPSLNNASALSVSLLRVGRGFMARHPARRKPEQPLELYEFEACPYCKKVRETLSELDIEYISRSAARGSGKRAQSNRLGGKEQYPFLLDPNTNNSMYESEDIIDYLHATYGDGRHLLWRALSPLNTASAMLASAARPRGGRVKGGARATQPEQNLVLYNFEASPYCRKVRESLCALDLDCHVINVARGGKRRAELLERGGKMMVPYLADANTGTEMYESDDIIAYLERTYGNDKLA